MHVTRQLRAGVLTGIVRIVGIVVIGAVPAAVSVQALSPAAASASASTITSTVASSGTTTAKPISISAAVQEQLLKLYAAYRHLPVTDIARVVPGMVHGAVVSPGGEDWAAITFTPAASAAVSVDVTFQDGASAGVFARPAGGTWTMKGLGGEPLGCGARLPAAVRALWQLSACTTPAVPPSTPGNAPAVTPAASANTAMALTAEIARSQVGIADNPRVTSFSGLDCDPYTAFEASWVSKSGCGTDSTFGTKDATEFWCADFAKWVWRQGGVTSDLSVLTPAAASFYTWGKDHGESMSEDPKTPQVGDAVVFYPGTAPNGSYADHVGIVTAVNSNGTVNLANGDFLGSSNISVQGNDNVSLKSWAASIWGSGETWTFVSPELSTKTHSASELIGTESKKCVDTSNATFAAGTKEQLYTCDKGAGQSWTYTSAGQLTVDGGTYCLEVFKRKTANGSIVDLWQCNGGPNQQWTFGPGGTIVSGQSGKCLNAKGAHITNGTQLVLYACNGQSDEVWSW